MRWDRLFGELEGYAEHLRLEDLPAAEGQKLAREPRGPGGSPLNFGGETAPGILLLDAIGWRGMFLIGALPLVTLLPLAYLKMPESPAWLASRGRMDEARATLATTAVTIPAMDQAATAMAATGRTAGCGRRQRARR